MVGGGGFANGGGGALCGCGSSSLGVEFWSDANGGVFGGCGVCGCCGDCSATGLGYDVYGDNSFGAGGGFGCKCS